MDWCTMPGFAAVRLVHIPPAIFKDKGYVLRQENSDKMCLLRKVVLLHWCNYSIESPDKNIEIPSKKGKRIFAKLKKCFCM